MIALPVWDGGQKRWIKDNGFHRRPLYVWYSNGAWTNDKGLPKYNIPCRWSIEKHVAHAS